MLRTVTNKVKYLAIFCRENIGILTKPCTVDVSMALTGSCRLCVPTIVVESYSDPHGSAFILVGWIRIRIQEANDP